METFRRPSLAALVTVLALGWTTAVLGQTSDISDAPDPGKGFWARWLERSDKARETQPHWVTPLATTTPRLEQELRFDVAWQQAKPGAPYMENLGNGKGLELIPAGRIEVIAAPPPYLQHNSPTVRDGFGDARVLLKCRLISANEEQGNYIVTAFLDATFPTGQGTNGQTNSIVTPTIAYGKGIGQFDVQGTLGAALPTGNEAAIGRTYTWNNAFQFRIHRRIWPEIEVNASVFEDGKNAGKRQVLLTPGLVVGRFPLTHRLGLTVGAGLQIPVSEFRTSTHTEILSIRLPF
jgi:hypothetical protein